MGSISRTTEVVNLKPLPGVSAMKSTFRFKNKFWTNFSTSFRIPQENIGSLISYRTKKGEKWSKTRFIKRTTSSNKIFEIGFTRGILEVDSILLADFF
jgi:hypothetical protein